MTDEIQVFGGDGENTDHVTLSIPFKEVKSHPYSYDAASKGHVHRIEYDGKVTLHDTHVFYETLRAAEGKRVHVVLIGAADVYNNIIGLLKQVVYDDFEPQFIELMVV